MPSHINWDELWVFIVLFAAVTILGFVANRWRRARLDNLGEWGLGGRTLGAVVTWFLHRRGDDAVHRAADVRHRGRARPDGRSSR